MCAQMDMLLTYQLSKLSKEVMSVFRYVSNGKKSIVFGALLLMVVGLESFIFAQNQPAPTAQAREARQMFAVNLVRVQPGMGREWQDLVKNELVPALKKGGVNQYIALRRDTFGGSGEFMLFRRIKDLAELDAPNPMVKALGQAGATALSAKLNRLTASLSTVGITSRSDLSIPLSGSAGSEPKLVGMRRITVAPGRIADFEKYAKEMVPVMGKTNAKILVARVANGGDINEYWQSLICDSFADLGQVSAALGKATTDARAPLPAGIVTHVEASTWRTVPELSIQPPAQKTTK